MALVYHHAAYALTTNTYHGKLSRAQQYLDLVALSSRNHETMNLYITKIVHTALMLYTCILLLSVQFIPLCNAILTYSIMHDLEEPPSQAFPNRTQKISCIPSCTAAYGHEGKAAWECRT